MKNIKESLVASHWSLENKENKRGFENLEVWRRSITLAREIYFLTNKFPNAELYGMTSQLRRASVSVASNIAEGCARNNAREFYQFLGVASGSLAEVKTQLVICKEVGLLDNLQDISDQIEIIAKMLSALKNKLKTNNQ